MTEADVDSDSSHDETCGSCDHCRPDPNATREALMAGQRGTVCMRFPPTGQMVQTAAGLGTVAFFAPAPESRMACGEWEPRFEEAAPPADSPGLTDPA